MKEIINIQKINIGGNRIAVCALTNSGFNDLPKSKELRSYFVKEYGVQVDTIMAVSKIDPTAVKTIVFEPNASTSFGKFSNMCGNGLKAIYQATASKVFITKAGTFFATKIDNKEYICTRECKDIPNININPLQKLVEVIIERPVLAIRLCANAEANPINGEPHLVVLLEEGLSLQMLVAIAKQYGEELSYLLKKSQTNVTFVSKFAKFSASACTFERNLGSDPNIAVTGSCGTGAIAAADTLRKFSCNYDGKYELMFPKDIQKVRVQNNQTYILTTNSYENI